MGGRFLSPAKAGSQSFIACLPRAALRFTSFRFACPGLNSAASFAGSLSIGDRRVVMRSKSSISNRHPITPSRIGCAQMHARLLFNHDSFRVAEVTGFVNQFM